MERITRRLFLRNTAAAGAVGAAASAPVAAVASAPMSPRDQVRWHIHEIERLVAKDGGKDTVILVNATYGAKDHRTTGINYLGQFIENDDMFAGKGSVA